MCFLHIFEFQIESVKRHIPYCKNTGIPSVDPLVVLNFYSGYIFETIVENCLRPNTDIAKNTARYPVFEFLFFVGHIVSASGSFCGNRNSQTSGYTPYHPDNDIEIKKQQPGQ